MNHQHVWNNLKPNCALSLYVLVLMTGTLFATLSGASNAEFFQVKVTAPPQVAEALEFGLEGNTDMAYFIDSEMATAPVLLDRAKNSVLTDGPVFFDLPVTSQCWNQGEFVHLIFKLKKNYSLELPSREGICLIGEPSGYTSGLNQANLRDSIGTLVPLFCEIFSLETQFYPIGISPTPEGV